MMIMMMMMMMINSFLKRAFGLCSQLFSFLDLADDADQTLFNSMLKKTTLFPSNSPRSQD